MSTDLSPHAIPGLDPVQVTRVHLTRGRDGRARLTGGGGVFRTMLLDRDATGVRACLVPARALLLAGDDVRLEVVVEDGLSLHLSEPGGTVAYDMRGGHARWATTYRVAAGAAVVHETLPWVSAEGSDVVRSTQIALAGDAAMSLRETLVLGRHGEQPGRLLTHTRVERDGAEVLVEEFDAADLALAPSHSLRVLDQLLLLGAIETPAPPTWTPLALSSGDTLLRHLE